MHKDAPADRVEWLQWAFQKAFCEKSYQDFNESKYMNLIESFRATDGARELITATIAQYRDVYKQLGMEVK